MLNGKKVGVVIPAAGSGTRMKGKRPKQFLTIRGKTILLRTLECFQRAGVVDCIIVVVKKNDIGFVQRMIRPRQLDKICGIVPGGRERQDSVWNGLQKLQRYNIDIVLVHDAVRPFISPGIIRSVTKVAGKRGAAIPAVHPKDTIKIADKKHIVKTTLAREGLWSVHTPQAFTIELLNRAFKKARKEKFYGTDEASIVEHYGAPVAIVGSSYDNIKITTAEDLEFARLMAKRLR